MNTWTKCRDFYRKEESRLEATYVDPTSWAVVYVRPEEFQGEMYAVVARWTPQGFSEEAVENRKVPPATINLMRKWSKELAVAKEKMLSHEELQALFDESPKEVKAAVLDGILDLISGLIDMEGIFDETYWVTREGAIVLTKDSPLHDRLEAIKMSPDDEVVSGKTLSEGVGKALFEFGVVRC